MESTIFESFTGNRDDANKLFVRLTVDQEYSTETVTPISIVVSEAFGMISPLISIQFIDGVGIYTNIAKFSPDAEFKLYFGNSMIKSIIIPLKFFKIEYTNTTLGRSDGIHFTLKFLVSSWQSLLSERHSRAWKNATLNSILTTIADEGGFDFSDKLANETNIPLMIQPNLTNKEFLKWIQTNKKSKYDDHYEFCTTLDNSFVFNSISGFLDKKISSILNRSLPVLRMEAPSEKKAIREEEKEINGSYPTYFMSFSLNDSYIDSIMHGAGGVESKYFDWETGEYVTKKVSLEDMNAIQFTDWTPVHTSHNKSHTSLYTGKDTATTERAYCKVSSTAMSISSVSISIEGTIKAKTGDILEIIIPSYVITPYNIFNSGFYLVTGVEHVINLQQGKEFTTSLRLHRQGYDGKQLAGYVKTKRGKFAG